jgi:hypothetical protein
MRATLVLSLLLTSVAPAGAAPLALFRLDPLGIQPDVVDQLERLLRVELERVAGGALPSRADIDKVLATNKKLAGCTADPECLAPIARALKSPRIVAGNVGGLADSYVVNLKLVEADGRELRRVTATLRGSQAELIEEIRVAAYRLVAPDRLRGGIAVLSDVSGAKVELDGAQVGTTPLAQPVANLSIGVHHLKVTRDGFSPFGEDVPVRFEKTTQVVVRQSATTKVIVKEPVYRRWWFWTAIGVAAVGVGIGIGFAIPKQSAIDCNKAMCP